MAECQKLPVMNKLSKEKDDIIRKLMPGMEKNYFEAGPQKFIVPESYKQLASTFYNYEVRPSDVWLFGYPRSGTTLTQEVLWLIGNDLDYEKAAKNVLDHRFPVIDHALMMNGEELVQLGEKSDASEDVKDIIRQYQVPHWKQLLETKERRFVKCHLPISLMNPKICTSGCKVVYCARNPKDVAVSNYMLLKLFLGSESSFQEFWTVFQRNLMFSTPWFENVKEAWDRRNDENFLFLFYEDIIKDKRKTIVKIADFLGKNLTSAQIDKLEDHISLDKFKKNKSVNNDHLVDIGVSKNTQEISFIRKGKAGGWREHFSPELAAEADKWIEENEKKYGFVIPK